MTYVFKGQNASTGESNKITGRMSFYGEVLAFNTRKEAIQYVEDFETPYHSDICVIGGRRVMRQYCLGMTVASFNEYLDFEDMNPTEKNGFGNWE